MKFTKKEVSLCKQIVEKYRKDIYRGDWYLPRKKDDQPELATMNIFHIDKGLFKDAIPLWTISDCLEFFKERNLQLSLNHFKELRTDYRNEGWRIQLWKDGESQAFYSDYSTEIKPKNETPLEACLKAILAVLGKEQK